MYKKIQMLLFVERYLNAARLHTTYLGMLADISANPYLIM
jgi:hypothetical protein